MRQYFNQFYQFKGWRLRPFRLIPLLFIIMVMSSLTLFVPRWQSDAEAAPVLASNGLDCSSSPFGNVLDLYPETEVFVGSTSSHPGFTHLPAFTLDLSNNTGYLHETNLVDTPNATNPSGHTAVAADLDGDGRTEFIQNFVSNNGFSYISRYNPDGTIISYQASTNLHAHLAAAAGNILGEDNEREQVVYAYVNQNTGALTVAIWSGANNNGSVEAVWRTTMDHRANATLVDVAVGNFNGNFKDDIVLAFLDNVGDLQLVALEYDIDHVIGNGNSPNYEYRLDDIATWSRGVGDLMDIQVTTARLNNDFLDEIIVAYEVDDPDSSLSTQIQLRVIYLADGQLVEQLSMQYTIQESRSYNFGLASGDVNGNFRQEVVVTYDSNSGAAGSGLVAKVLQGQDLNTLDPTLGLYSDWFVPWSSERDRARRLDTAVNDLNRDGYAEIVLSLDDGRGLEIIYIDHDMLGTNTLPIGHWVNLDPTNLTGTTALALGDQDNNTLKGVYAPNPGTPGDCRPITERRITAAIFTPPYWEHIQLNQNSRGAIGRTVSQNQSQESAYSYERSHSTSGFIGVGVSSGFGPASFESNVRRTAEESYSRSETHGSGIYTSTTEFVQTFDENPFVTFEESYYDCYGYEIQENGVPVTDTTSVRNCEFLETVKSATALPSWETTYGPLSDVSGMNEALSWSPLVRDWANLALFRRDFVTQSSSSNAVLAVDGNLSGVPIDMTATHQENNPWWQVDLGQSERLTKIRLWGLEDPTNCQVRTSCPAMLTDVYVFVSDAPFVSDDPTVLLNDANVFHTSLANISPALTTITSTFPTGRVTTLQTLAEDLTPVNGRYVRVQIARDNAILSLAEVQVFGDNHVEPDRYPVDVRDPLADDDFFQVQLYDAYEINTNAQYKWIDVRGNLLWDRNAPLDHLIGPGGATVEWALSQETGNNQLAASSESHNTTVGVEFDLTVGVLAQVQIGGGEQFGTGITQEDSFRTSWGEAFNMGGYVEGFPSDYGEPPWLFDCRYRVRPYFYELTEESTFGVTTGFNVLAYTVPVSSPTDLDRTADLQNCHNGNLGNAVPLAAPDSFGMVMGGSLTMSVLANDLGNNLEIIDVSQPLHGTATHSQRTITYTPQPGYTGGETFTYTISDGTTISTGTVTVNITMHQLFLPMVVR
jgi:hypothetical protein